MYNLNHIQIQILQKLLFSNGLRYTDIKPKALSSSHFKYYLDSLLADNLIQKNNSTYSLTKLGKHQANKMDTDERKLKSHSKITSKLCCVRVKDGKKQLLVYKRLKNPFFGHMGIPTHKIWYGEKNIEAVKSGLNRECGLFGKPTLIGIRKFIVEFESEIVEDKTFYIYSFNNIKGEITNNRDGEYFWCNFDDLGDILNPKFPEFDEIFKVLNNNFSEFFKEICQKVKVF